MKDSGNSQSSNGGDEEHNPLAASTTDNSFFINTRAANISDLQPSPMFDTFPSFTQNPNPSSLFIQNAEWSGSIPDPIHGIITGSPGFLDDYNAVGAGAPANHVAPHNPKKRSRAARRAHTTVLNTDTANFRAMVQEFTGIPSSPFNNPPLQRNRLDLPGGERSPPPPPYLRRPLPLKPQSPPPPPSFLPSSTTAGYNFLRPNSIPENQNIFNFRIQTNPRKFLFPNSTTMIPQPSDENRINGLDGFEFSNVVNQVTDRVKINGHDHARNAENPYSIPANGMTNFTADFSSDFVQRGGDDENESWICSSELR